MLTAFLLSRKFLEEIENFFFNNSRLKVLRFCLRQSLKKKRKSGNFLVKICPIFFFVFLIPIDSEYKSIQGVYVHRTVEFSEFHF
jgi:hypothetical protein